MFEFLFKFPREDYARAELVFTGGWPAGILVAAAILALLGVTWLLGRRRTQASLTQLITVGLLQLGVIFFVLLLLMQPALRTENLVAGQNDIALVLDTSESMRYGSESTRLDTARQALDDAATAVADLAMGIRRYEFSAAAAAVETFAQSQAAGNETAIAASLVRVLEDASSNPLAAVVLASDGIETSGGVTEEAIAEIAAFGVPVYALAAGRASIPEDLELTRVAIPSRILPGSTVPVRVTLRHDRGGDVRVKLFDGDSLLAAETVALRDDVTTSTVTIDVEGLDNGYRQLETRVDPLEDETELRNNRQVTLVNVEARKRRILYFEGEPRWEYKFLRRAIHDEELLDLATLLSVSPNKFYRQGIESAEELEDGFPATRAELFAYDAVIIGSVPVATFTPEQLAVLRDFVSERGGSLLLLAGRNGLGNGGWGQSRIAEVLPAALPPSSTNSFFRVRVPAALTPQGADLQMLRLSGAAEANRAAWQELPAIADYQLTGALKPAATVLVSAATEDGNVPLLLTQPFGRGHAWILATGGTWRWQMSLPSDDQRHETFWRQLLRALAAAAPPRESVVARSRGEQLELRAEFLDEAYRPAANLDVVAAVSHASGEALSVPLQQLPGEPGVYRATLDAPQAGAWYVETMARQAEETVAAARSATYAAPGQAEYARIRADADTLERLVAATGGRLLDAAEVAALPDVLRYSRAGITEIVDRPIWDAPIALLLLLAAKSAEWLLRRRWNTI